MTSSSRTRATTTRTLNPLHFEDLEPHRFEDLVRQLAYGFRTWKVIEPTGRLGADDGVDIRAVEAGYEFAEPIDEEDEESIARPVGDDRIWVFQCKREQSITPQKVKDIIRDGVPAGGDVPYGYVLAAACDFSKRTRDVFRDELIKRGVREFYLWGKADLEDALFLPQNDHLLFAYFNISIQARRRSMRSLLTARLTMKRKLFKTVGDLQRHRTQVLIRDPREERYPRYQDIADFTAFPRWQFHTFRGHQPANHIMLETERYAAYLSDDREHWDAILSCNFGGASIGWTDIVPKYSEERLELERKSHSYFYKRVPERNQAWLTVVRFIHYDKILGIDELGDAYYNTGPHIFVEFDRMNGPFEPDLEACLVESTNSFYDHLKPTKENRIAYFPQELPKEIEE